MHYQIIVFGVVAITEVVVELDYNLGGLSLLRFRLTNLLSLGWRYSVCELVAGTYLIELLLSLTAKSGFIEFEPEEVDF